MGNVQRTGGSGASESKSLIRNLAQDNEVGIFNPGYFSAGKFPVEYTYTLYPPIEYNAAATHLNLKIACENHITYRAIRFTIPADNVAQVYVYPPSQTTQKSGNH